MSERVRSAAWPALLAGALTLGLAAPTSAAPQGKPATATVAAPSGDLSVGRLRTNDLMAPLAVDTAKPALSWTVDSTGFDHKQTHYQVQAAGSAAALTAGTDLLWDSGRAAGSDMRVDYGGQQLPSRTRVVWRVRVWNGAIESAWSAPAAFEMGLLESSDWKASWIKRSAEQPASTITNQFPEARSARYLRLEVYETGPVPAADPVNRLQLMELRVNGADGQNYATGATATGSNSFTPNSQWSPANLLDGNVRTGFTTTSFPTAKHPLATPLWLQLDLKQQRSGISSVQLVGRTDTLAVDGRTTPNYPVRYRVLISDDASAWTQVGFYSAGASDPAYDALGQPTPFPAPSFSSEAWAPMFADDFSVDAGKTVARARLYVTGVGLYYAEVNGKPVSDSYFDPSESDYRKRVFYSAYDVTDKLRPGTNGVGFMLGNGIYGNGVSPNGGRYEKTDGLPYGAQGLHGTAKGLAQLEVTYTDGTTTTVASDDRWQFTDSYITFNTWFGGEDHDARRARQLAGWSSGTGDRSGWAAAVAVPASERPRGALVARPTEPMRITETLKGTSVTEGQFPSGSGWIDVSRNGAGFQGVLFAQDVAATYAGVSLRFFPAEIKTPTDVDQSSSKAGNAPVYDTYTFSGAERAGEAWNPRFVYHGARYYRIDLELPAGRTAGDYGFAGKPAMLKALMDDKLDFAGHIVRTDNEVTGGFDSSNTSIDQIHTIIDRSIQSQMYSVFTDCPHIEKLGWMETSHLMFNSIAATYDIRSWMAKISQDALDSQVTDLATDKDQAGAALGEPGYAMAIAPAFQIIRGLNRDPNWNGAIVLTPWEHYLNYGDPSVLARSYDGMRAYMKYLEDRYAANNYIVNDAQMGDWGEYQVSTPPDLVVTGAFYRMADAMGRVATVLGKSSDHDAYTALAGKIKTSFNARFFNAATGVYGSGTQASYAVPLFSGLVDGQDQQRVVDALVKVTEARNYTITTGEVALKQMFSVLAKYGRSDVIYKMVLQPNQPGYRYIAETLGETTMIEYWDYRDRWGAMRSRNHAMMGSIQEWFTRSLGGIDRAGAGYDELVIKPYVPDNAALPADMRTTSVASSIGSDNGIVRSDWTVSPDNRQLTMNVTVPVGSTATVYVPALGYRTNAVRVSYGSVQDEKRTGTYADGYVRLDDIPSGRYTFTRTVPTIASIDDVQLSSTTVPFGQLATALGSAGARITGLTGTTTDNERISVPVSAATYTAANGYVNVSAGGAITASQNGADVITVRVDGASAQVPVTARRTTLRALRVRLAKPSLVNIRDQLALGARGQLDTGEWVDLPAGSVPFAVGEGGTLTGAGSNLLGVAAGTTAARTIGVSATATFDAITTTAPERAVPYQPRPNVAAGAVASANTFHNGRFGDYSPAGALDGDRGISRWSSGGGWSTELPGEGGGLPAWWQVNFGSTKDIGQVDVVTYDSKTTPPTLETDFSGEGITAFQVQAWQDGQWVTVPGGAVVGNTKTWRQLVLPAPVRTDRLRVYVTGTAGNQHANLAEVEAYETVPAARPAGALSTTAGGTTTVPVALTFDQEVVGLDAPDIQVQNGTVARFEGNGTRFTFDVTATAGGDVTVSLPAGAAESIDGALSSAVAPLTINVGGPSSTSTPITATATVPGVLSLTLSESLSFGAFAPGATKDYDAGSLATVTSTAADATLSVADTAATAPGHLVNGTYVMPSALQVRAGDAEAFKALSATPTTLRSYAGPVSKNKVTLGFRQHVEATDDLRRGAYAKTLTFTLSTSTP